MPHGRPELDGETWTIRHVRPLVDNDATRSQRWLKIRAHVAVPEYDVSLYIDNSVVLEQAPELVLTELFPPDAMFAAMAHGFRSSVAAEFAEVVGLRYESRDRAPSRSCTTV